MHLLLLGNSRAKWTHGEQSCNTFNVSGGCLNNQQLPALACHESRLREKQLLFYF